MDAKKSKNMLIGLALFYLALIVMIYAVANPQFRYLPIVGDAPIQGDIVEPLTDDRMLTQPVLVASDRISGVDILAHRYGSQDVLLTVELTDADGHVLAARSIATKKIVNNQYTSIAFERPVEGRRGQTLMLRLYVQGATAKDRVDVFGGDRLPVGRFDIIKDVAEQQRYSVDGQAGSGMLCVRLTGIRLISFYWQYWIITGVIFLAAAVYAVIGYKNALKGRVNGIARLCAAYSRYEFLLHQLVSRDFKRKYKRSSLGMAWSVLNPLLTMLVQYFVFSTLFKSNIPNYPVFLLTGIVFFGFFTEATGSGMQSIIGDAALIKKVYMPKYIYPISRTITSTINFLLSLIPLFVVILITGTPLKPSMLLLIFVILCQIGFLMGMVLILSTCMTFFQDTQFLWRVLQTMWMYMTPIFYNEAIIPAGLRGIYHINPMYQYITFARICIISGASPEPMAYLWCLLSSVSVLLLGLYVFKKNQNKFILYM